MFTGLKEQLAYDVNIDLLQLWPLRHLSSVELFIFFGVVMLESQ